MAWNSVSFDPTLVQTNSDAASSALASASDAASKAGAALSGAGSVTVYTDNHTILTSEFGKTLCMNHADSKTFTLPSVGAEDSGGEVTLMKIGAGNVPVVASDSDKVGESGNTQVTISTAYGIVKVKYIHDITTWVVVGSKGTITGA